VLDRTVRGGGAVGRIAVDASSTERGMRRRTRGAASDMAASTLADNPSDAVGCASGGDASAGVAGASSGALYGASGA
jgi:hypothetical protein